MTKKWVYLFSEGNAGMRDLLGGKGAGVAEMTNIGIPVPPGFTITTEACNYYSENKVFPEGMWDQVLASLKEIEKQTGKRFGDAENPLLVSVRSGAKFSMPGMMDTVLNLGLNDDTLQGIIKLTGNERFAYDAYRRFVQMFGRIVMGIDGAKFEHILEETKKAKGARYDTDLTAADLKEVLAKYKEVYKQETGEDFPNDPLVQMEKAMRAVFSSWNNPRAIAYRNFRKIPHDLGTAVNVQTMVFGNMGENSGTGVAFSREPTTGEKKLYGEYLLNAQGEDVVAGVRTPQKIEVLKQELPQIYAQFASIAERLERHYRDMQDMEFTVERGKLWMLQTRTGQRTAQAAVKIAVDMVNERLITKEEAVQRVDPNSAYQLLLPRFDQKAKDEAQKNGRLLATGLNASPGAARGKAVFDADRAVEMGSAGEPVILVRPETNPDDVHGMLVARGILTSRGGATSHAAVVARGLGKPCVSGTEAIRVDPAGRSFSADGKVIKEGDFISIDGTTGQVFEGEIATIDPVFSEEKELQALLTWADEIREPKDRSRRPIQVWANADYPRDAAKAREFGAQGIGLCRTEHMFFEQDRLPIVQQMILAAREATDLDQAYESADTDAKRAESDKKRQASAAWHAHHDSLARLLPIQKEDFKGIFRVMNGLPVIIRLLDPPLHEFLPSHEELSVEVGVIHARLKYGCYTDVNDPEYRSLRSELAEKEKMLAAVTSMAEMNPMLGLRGCRLGLTYPAINVMQVRAILGAAIEVEKDGVDVHPEIMIPLIGHINELSRVKDQLVKVAEQVEQEYGTHVPYKFGTMIEVPRAALTADEIAEAAEFFSFGTNDLTQTTFAISRDDAEGKFLLRYVDQKILPENPFQVLDRAGVGKLMAWAVEQGRKTRPDLEVGICGEHGGDPSSIEFSYSIGLNYVSCSPFRVPVARLAAAQAALTKVERDR
ncbi:MAG: pyruvate, phosphate dikinase [Chloroflexi bacterium]|nr:pyruvate, phosphate dikinase [Chloroflexota bacterium]MCL5025351.1 pyruvate, phosphate dikinase [Chloroflexota bacterium]